MDTNNAPDIVRSYTLAMLFGHDHSIVIPDLQRDYCWGNIPLASSVSRESKATIFVKGIVSIFEQGRQAVLGLLYGYNQPSGSRNIHIIDGQQRLTTLYLLVGLLNRRIESDRLRRFLISDFKLIDDHEPRLVFQARGDAMYFMVDLVSNFFLNKDGCITQLESSNWYYETYSADPTIRSLIGALRQIDQVLDTVSSREDWSFERFSEFILSQLTFLYCDVASRQAAEQMFVTINTTGQPLTLMQKLRSLALLKEPDKTKVAEQYNEIETWAWSNRHSVSYDMLSEIYLTNFQPIEEFSFDDYFRYFRAVSQIWPLVADKTDGSICDKLMAFVPCVRYVQKFGSEASDSNICRLWHMLTNIMRYQKPTANGSDVAAAANMVNAMPHPDLLCLINMHNVSTRILNDEERSKLIFIKRHAEQRTQIERLLSKAESHPILNGKVSKVLIWCEKASRRSHVSQIETLAYYVEGMYKLFMIDQDQPTLERIAALDLLRRALLTLQHDQYPIVRRGDTILSLCWHDYDWQRLMLNAPGLIRQIIDRCDGHQPKKVLYEMIDRYKDVNNPYYFIIKDKHLLDNCRKRQILRPCAAFMGLFDFQLGYVRWHINQKELCIDNESWMPFRAYGCKCLYTDHRRLNIAIDIYYDEHSEMPYHIEVFSRADVDTGVRRHVSLRAIMMSLGKHYQYDKKRQRSILFFRSSSAVVDTIVSLTDIVSVYD